MPFGNLHAFKINLTHPVSLTDDDVLELVSAWPRSQELVINHDRAGAAPRLDRVVSPP